MTPSNGTGGNSSKHEKSYLAVLILRLVASRMSMAVNAQVVVDDAYITYRYANLFELYARR